MTDQTLDILCTNFDHAVTLSPRNAGWFLDFLLLFSKFALYLLLLLTVNSILTMISFISEKLEFDANQAIETPEQKAGMSLSSFILFTVTKFSRNCLIVVSWR